MENKQTLDSFDIPPDSGQSEPVTKLKQCPDFLRVWKGQSVSVFGSQMVAFAFSIWIYQQTQSLIHFGMVISAQLLPTLVLAPVAGILIDKFSRRKVMFYCQVGLTLVSALLFYLAWTDQLNATNILLISPLIASFGSVHQIAYSASVSQLVPKPLYAKANGYVQSGIHLSAVIIPTIAVGLLETVGLAVIMLLSIGTYILSALSLQFSDFPYQPKAKAKKAIQSDTEQNQVAIGRYLLQNSTSMILISFLSLVSFLSGIVLVLFRPMILTTLSSITLGIMVTFAGIGGLAGALMAGKMAARDDKLTMLVLSTMVSGIAMVLCGQMTNTIAISILVVVYSFSSPIALVIAQTILQTIVPASMQGRIFATRRFFVTLALILAVTVAPILSEVYFEPLMLEGQSLANAIGDMIGVGPGRGMGLVFVLSGLLMLIMTLLFSLSGPFRRLKVEISKHNKI